METLIRTFALVLTCSSAAAFADTTPDKATTCATCHGSDGNSSNPMYPILAGQHAQYLKKQLNDFRSGKRSDPVMGAMAKSLTDDDIKALADHYSKMKQQ